MPTRRHLLKTLAKAAAVASPALRSAAPAQPPTTPDAPLHDPLRPRFHLLPARNWINDPCAPLLWRGQYHMFYQYNPGAAVWGDMHWAHAVSPDMVHWQRLPVALSPTPSGPDSAGCFTGSALLHNGRPAVIYTGVQSVAPDQHPTLADGHSILRETQLLATPADRGLRTWTKRPNPVIPAPPPGLSVTGFRDPSPFTHAGAQYLIVGSGVRGQGGMVLLYRALNPDDLTRWEYLHPLAQDTAWVPPSPTFAPNPVDSGEMWECPDFFQLGAKHVLIYSTQGRPLWQVGELDPATLTFHPQRSGELDLGRSFYAPKTQLDAHGNRILWGWINETRPQAEYAAAGWAGMISLPRVLTLDGNDLRMAPLPALRSLRRSTAAGGRVSTGGPVQEFTATLRPTHTGEAAPPFLLSDAQGPLFAIQATEAPGPRPANTPNSIVRPPSPLQAEALLQVFFDNSVAELFLDGRFCHTERFYSRSPTAPVLTLLLPSAAVVEHRSFSLRPIWPA